VKCKRKSKMGRPPLPASERCTKRVNLRLTPAEYRTLRAEARAARIGMATYLVRMWRESKGA